MIYVICGIGIIVVFAVMAFGFAELAKPMPPPPKGSHAEYLTDDERLGVQCSADLECAIKLARSRGWVPPARTL